MKRKNFTVPVKIDATLFRNFAVYDTFWRQRRWISPGIFAGIMLFFSAIAFSRVGKAEQATLLGMVLLVVGLILPAVYFVNYLLSLHEQIKKLRLSTARDAYMLRLDSDNGVEVSNEKEHVRYRWSELHAAYRTKNCIYLYASPNKAYLLPTAQIQEGADSLWELLCAVLPKEALHDSRRGSPR